MVDGCRVISGAVFIMDVRGGSLGEWGPSSIKQQEFPRLLIKDKEEIV